MSPDAELGVLEPFGNPIRLQSFERAVERAFLDLGQRGQGGLAERSAEQSAGAASVETAWRRVIRMGGFLS